MSFNITANDLDLADDRKYQDYIVRSGMQDGKTWVLLLEPERVDRTLESLTGIKASLEHQLEQAKLYQKGGDQDWRRRTQNLLRMVAIYLLDAESEVKRLDQEDADAGAAAELERWKTAAMMLSDRLAGHPVLELIYIPRGEGRITAAAWVAERAAEAKAAREAEEAA